MNNNNPQRIEQDISLELKPLIFKYILGYWWLYILSFGLCIGGVYMYLRYADYLYEVSSTLLIKNPASSGNLTEESLVLREIGLVGSDRNIENEILILRSRTLIEKVVNKLKLNITYFSKGRLKDGEYYKNSPIILDSFYLKRKKNLAFEIEILNSDSFRIYSNSKEYKSYKFGEEIENSKGKFIFNLNKENYNPNYKDYRIKLRNSKDVAASFLQKIKVTPAKPWSSVLLLKIKDQIPARAADFINELVITYQKATIDDKNEVSRNTLEFIEDRLKIITSELTIVEGDVTDYKKQQRISTEAADNVQMLFDELSSIEKQLADLEIKKGFSASIEEYVNPENNDFRVIPSILIFNNAALEQLISSYNSLTIRKNKLAETASLNNPVYLQLESELEIAKNNIKQTLNILNDDLTASIKQLEKRRGFLNEETSSIPTKEKGLLELKRQKFIKENLYLYLLEKKEETLLSMAITVSNSKVIDSARASNRPIEPKKNIIYLFGVFLGVLFPIGFVIIKDLLDDKINIPSDLNTNQQIPFLGGIAHSKKNEQIVISKSDRSAIAEMLRGVRTNLQFLVNSKKDGKKVILVTSSSSGEGKSFISANLGMTLALSGEKVVVLEMDLRKPKVSNYLGINSTQEIGISSFLVNDSITADQLIYPTKFSPNLFVISSGPIPPNPAELLLDDKVNDFFDSLKKKFDYIIVDTPPIGLVADAFLLKDYCSTSIFVVKAGYTPKKIVKMLDDVIGNEKLNQVTFLLNGVKKGHSYDYDYGYGYGYGYGYSDKSYYL